MKYIEWLFKGRLPCELQTTTTTVTGQVAGFMMFAFYQKGKEKKFVETLLFDCLRFPKPIIYSDKRF